MLAGLVLGSWAGLFFIASLITLWLLNPADNPATNAAAFSPWELAIDRFFGSAPGMYVLGALLIAICGYLLAVRIRRQAHSSAAILFEHAAVNGAFSLLFLLGSMAGSVFFGDLYRALHASLLSRLFGAHIDGFLLAVCLALLACLCITQRHGVAEMRWKILR